MTSHSDDEHGRESFNHRLYADDPCALVKKTVPRDYADYPGDDLPRFPAMRPLDVVKEISKDGALAIVVIALLVGGAYGIVWLIALLDEYSQSIKPAIAEWLLWWLS